MKLANDIADLLQRALDSGALKDQPVHHALAVGKLTMWRDGLADETLRELARDQALSFGDGNDCEIDDDARTSEGDEGTWVSGWVWVADSLRTDEPEESDESASEGF